MSAVAWQPTATMKCEEWLRHGEQLGTIGRAAAWWIGDWVNYGNVKFGEKYSRAARITGYDVQSLMNMAYVASRFEQRRRRERLSWSHHAEVAALEVHDQDRWLRHAEDSQLSVRGLRELLRAERRRLSGGSASRKNRMEPAVEESGHITDPTPVCPNCGFHLAERGLSHEKGLKSA
ncbi:LmbU family transcriptional regulator [Nocardia sp. CDC159]|uniref:LmbU family transcriptional regulator n=1 Tax=Nocardia pulmonis TaxID=2951408 RepID=A0A9X2J015_9NOCA|nr:MULTISPECIES: LmbU family transcriptional regulator [Nocardia]MCM6778717.1 LmbU family transcriptional regulator [Nocardia pulmonis]MCM6791606.1 LmbU family transcriptional regulator [Nocardia sp. CDC159]